VAIGMLSLIVWTLLITTSIKYVAVVMRADNDGEGGILALMSLLGIKHGDRAGVIAIGVLGAALLHGDGAITPAISVLSALEGLKLPMPAIAPYVVPLSVAVLVGIFALQPQGSARIGKLFGPVMTVWFIVIGVLGLMGVITHPGVLVSFDPRYGLTYPRFYRLPGSRRGVPVRHRGRGALCRYGPLRTAADPLYLVRACPPDAAPQLCGAGGCRGRWKLAATAV
jgi:KUP system potassium uptake protein